VNCQQNPEAGAVPYVDSDSTGTRVAITAMPEDNPVAPGGSRRRRRQVSRDGG